MMERGTKYNGWTNYETWLVGLYFNDVWNDTDDTTHTVDAEYLKEYVEEFIYDQQGIQTHGMVSDILNSFGNSVNWYELAKHVNESKQMNATQSQYNTARKISEALIRNWVDYTPLGDAIRTAEKELNCRIDTASSVAIWGQFGSARNVHTAYTKEFRFGVLVVSDESEMQNLCDYYNGAI